MLALVVTPSSLLGSSLDQLLLSPAGVSAILAFDAVTARVLLAERRPDLVLAAGWLAEGELVPLMVDAGRLLPGALRIAVEVTEAEAVLLETEGVDVVLIQGQPASRLLEAVAARLAAPANEASGSLTI